MWSLGESLLEWEDLLWTFAPHCQIAHCMDSGLTALMKCGGADFLLLNLAKAASHSGEEYTPESPQLACLWTLSIVLAERDPHESGNLAVHSLICFLAFETQIYSCPCINIGIKKDIAAMIIYVCIFLNLNFCMSLDFPRKGLLKQKVVCLTYNGWSLSLD